MEPAVNISKDPNLFFLILFSLLLEFCYSSLIFVLTESSSLAEKKPTEYKPAPAPKKKHTANLAVQKNSSSIKKDVRPEIEQALVVKLESMGVKPVSSVLKLWTAQK